MKKSIIFSALLVLLLTLNIYPQKKEGIKFTVSATGKVNVLADIINITINLGVENKDPQNAFDEHKTREQKIIRLIKKYNIPDKDISYSLFRISKFRDYRDKTVSFKTNQSIHFILKDFKKYIPLQIALLKNGFYEFNSNFSTSKGKEGHEKSVKVALQNARDEAELYAANLNLKVGDILSISTNNPIVYPRSDLMLKAEMAPNQALINIPQYIAITTTVRIDYLLMK